MKLWLCYLLFPFPSLLTAQNAGIKVRQVNVSFTYGENTFPKSWRAEPINARGQEMNPRFINRSKNVIIKALSKYPEKLLKSNLKGVYFLKEMMFYDVGYGGTNSENAVYLTNRGPLMGYTDKYLEQTFHHEFSSILLRNYPAFLDTNEWKGANVEGFIYNDPERGVGAIRNNKSSQALDTLLCQKGVMTQYGASSIENDLNTFAQNLFCPEYNFWNYVDRFPAIKKKVNLLIRFYHKLNPVYTEDYFRKMDTP